MPLLGRQCSYLHVDIVVERSLVGNDAEAAEQGGPEGSCHVHVAWSQAPDVERDSRGAGQRREALADGQLARVPRLGHPQRRNHVLSERREHVRNFTTITVNRS